MSVPTTIIAGERDFMTPSAAAVRMSELIRDSELLVLPGCTHYAPVERPDLINEAVERLIDRCGGGW
ncbi:MAG: alpha/beta hydrolase [Deltaproteobacteria bacterium]|nr:alpha/beta hydrolase [Deltaproteobacteria bacterium]